MAAQGPFQQEQVLLVRCVYPTFPKPFLILAGSFFLSFFFFFNNTPAEQKAALIP